MRNLDKGNELNSHLFKVRDAVSTSPPELETIKATLVELSVYLSLPAGRTNENCITTDTFFRLHDDYGFN